MIVPGACIRELKGGYSKTTSELNFAGSYREDTQSQCSCVFLSLKN